MELFDQDGNIVEAFTKEELDQQLIEAKSELETKIAEQEKIINEKEEALGKEGDKENNFVKLRKAKETAEKQLEAMKTELEGKISEVKSEVSKRDFENAVAQLAGDDEDAKSKIKFHYDNFKGDPKDDKERAERLENAFILATGSKPLRSVPGSIVSTGSPYIPPASKTQGKISEGAKTLAGNLGLTEEDLKKHKLI
jgi:hypothetical protein